MAIILGSRLKRRRKGCDLDLSTALKMTAMTHSNPNEISEVPYNVERTFIHLPSEKSGASKRSHSQPPTPTCEVVSEMNQNLKEDYAAAMRLVGGSDAQPDKGKEDKEEKKEDITRDPAIAHVVHSEFSKKSAEKKARQGEKTEDGEQKLRVSRTALAEMRLLTQVWRVPSSRWIRVVHSGYGNAAWQDALRASKLCFVAASAHPEGVYVHIPPDTGREAIFHMLKKLNFGVREQTHFVEMKRANKSRLQFKDELLITPTEDANSDKKDSDNGDVSSTTASGKDTPPRDETGEQPVPLFTGALANTFPKEPTLGPEHVKALNGYLDGLLGNGHEPKERKEKGQGKHPKAAQTSELNSNFKIKKRPGGKYEKHNKHGIPLDCFMDAPRPWAPDMHPHEGQYPPPPPPPPPDMQMDYRAQAMHAQNQFYPQGQFYHPYQGYAPMQVPAGYPAFIPGPAVYGQDGFPVYMCVGMMPGAGAQH